MEKSSKMHLVWQTGHHKTLTDRPEQWLPATVPGAIQMDMIPALEHPDWQFSDRYKQFLWMEDVFWTCRSRFPQPELAPEQRLLFISKGIDYRFEIHLNERKIHEQEGMFTQVILDLTELLKKDNLLEVILFPVPKAVSSPADMKQASKCLKPAVSYGWDWHPRLVPSGIWDETWLEIKNSIRLTRTDYSYQLDHSLENATITGEGEVTGMVSHLRLWAEFEGKKIMDKQITANGAGFRFSEVLENIKLWWPYELGKQNLYEFHLDLAGKDGMVKDSKTWKWGFRKVRLVMNEGAWEKSDHWPKSRSNAPMTIEVNNIKIFAKGTNWVNPEVFPGIIDEVRYTRLLSIARDMNFNLLRVWGGGIINKDFFFKWCDEHGMMVWQEFPLSCNNYPDDPSYLRILKQEATSVIHRVGKHPCLVLWCGGNELFNSWSGMTDQSLALRWLNSLCLQYSPEIPYIPTSPVTGVGHGHYIFYDAHRDEDVFQINNRSEHTALPEFGMPSPSDPDILRTIIPGNELFPPSPTAAWTAHHAYMAWVGQTWLCQDIIEKYFGKSGNLEELVTNGQKLQAIGYQAIFEHARQRWPECSMALNWCFNEPWPTAANNSIIQYPDRPKPCAESIRQACRPVLASARIPKYSWSPGEVLTFTLFLINGTQKVLPGGEMEVYVNARKIHSWQYAEVPANENLCGAQITCPLREAEGDWVLIELHVPGNEQLDSQYELHMKRESFPNSRD